ncbi:hypothetical protein DL93DRAFT_1501674 [Clavulina sp. PMI_390]|nr:hypothetical protein DL93DRAFT_1501674 [Clavulina sp. PMI_390]
MEGPTRILGPHQHRLGWGSDHPPRGHGVHPISDSYISLVSPCQKQKSCVKKKRHCSPAHSPSFLFPTISVSYFPIVPSDGLCVTTHHVFFCIFTNTFRRLLVIEDISGINEHSNHCFTSPNTLQGCLLRESKTAIYSVSGSPVVDPPDVAVGLYDGQDHCVNIVKASNKFLNDLAGSDASKVRKCVFFSSHGISFPDAHAKLYGFRACTRLLENITTWNDLSAVDSLTQMASIRDKVQDAVTQIEKVAKRVRTFVNSFCSVFDGIIGLLNACFISFLSFIFSSTEISAGSRRF